MNLWWIAFFSALIYGLPLAFGYDLFGKPLSIESRVMMLCVVYACFICALFSRQHSINEVSVAKGGAARFYGKAFVAISALSFILLLLMYGTAFFFVHKTESGVSGYIYMLWRISSTAGVIWCLVLRRYRMLLIPLVPLIATLFAGDRTTVGLTAVAAIWILLQSRTVSFGRMMLVLGGSLALGTFLFFGKTFQAQWVTGTFESLPSLARTVIANGQDSVIRTEPFAIFGVFNALTSLSYGPPGSLIVEVAAQVLIMPSFFGFSASSFNDFFQPILFPAYREHSLAYSYWGEGFVRGGWLGFIGFLIIYLLVLRFFDGLSRRGGPILRCFSFAGGAYWAFYIHRNSMVSIISYERQIALYFVGVVILALAFRAINRSASARRGRSW